MTPFQRDMLIEKWMSTHAIEIGKRLGEMCDHWFSQETFYSISDTTDRYNYYRSSFSPVLIISSDLGEIKVKLKCCSMSHLRFEFSPDDRPELFCQKEFPLTERELEKELNKFLI